MKYIIEQIIGSALKKGTDRMSAPAGRKGKKLEKE